jgi:hypothetical protein
MSHPSPAPTFSFQLNDFSNFLLQPNVVVELPSQTFSNLKECSFGLRINLIKGLDFYALK